MTNREENGICSGSIMFAAAVILALSVTALALLIPPQGETATRVAECVEDMRYVQQADGSLTIRCRVPNSPYLSFSGGTPPGLGYTLIWSAGVDCKLGSGRLAIRERFFRNVINPTRRAECARMMADSGGFTVTLKVLPASLTIGGIKTVIYIDGHTYRVSS